MNRLPPAGDGRWRLPRHAHVVVYEAGRFRDGAGHEVGGGRSDDGDGAGGDGSGRAVEPSEADDGGDGGAAADAADDTRGAGTDDVDSTVTADEPDELLTIYDCGAAQKPPSAQLIGHLVRVRADADVERTETGYVVRMREPSVLEEQGEGRWVIAER